MRPTILWIFTLQSVIIKISGLLVPDYKSRNSIPISTNQSMEKFRYSNNSCRLGTGERIATQLSSLSSEKADDLFLLWTCYQCLHNIAYKKLPERLLDYKNDTQMELACNMDKVASISPSSCLKRVKECCLSARACCVRQLKQVRQPSHQFCPMTWDGISCVDETPINSTIKIICPTFVPNFLGQKSAEKQCLKNGNWLTVTESNETWEPTDYSKCNVWLIENEYLLSQIKASILILSIIMLMVSLFIFVFFRSLRTQKRIKIHINLFLTLFLKTSFELINTVVLGMDTYKRLTVNPLHSRNIFHENEEACKWITILLRYFQNSTFCWMLCEALFLYQLLFRTFEHISNIRIYLFIGWILPSIYTMIYFFIRRFHPAFKSLDRDCWVEEPPKMEYLMRGPNIIVMLINIILLINILCLIRNLPAQPDDRSDWKRTLKAVLILVPLFGLHFILVAFQIDTVNNIYFGYSLAQNIVQDSQGVAVSLAFCAMNQEVISIIKQRFYIGRCTSRLSLPRNHSVNRNSNSSRSSDHFRVISIQSQIPMILRQSPSNRNAKESLKKCDNTKLIK